MTDYVHALPIGSVLAGYEVVRVLGLGGFGITYAGVNPITEHEVAIKEFFPTGLATRDASSRLSYSQGRENVVAWALQKFEQTTRELCRLSHPNIVRVFNYVRENNTGYMIMELLDGVTLAQKIGARGTLEVAELRAHLQPVLDALAYVHARGLVHRDVAPDNILICRDSRPVLIDFGALSRDISAASRHLGTAGIMKPHFTAPDQAIRNAVPGPTTDIYSLGAVLYYATTGEMPADGIARNAEMALGEGDPYLPLEGRAPPGVPAEMAAAIDACLSLRRRDRPQSIADLAARLGWDDGVGLPSLTRAVSGPVGATFGEPALSRPAPSQPAAASALGGHSSPGPAGSAIPVAAPSLRPGPGEAPGLTAPPPPSTPAPAPPGRGGPPALLWLAPLLMLATAGGLYWSRSPPAHRAGVEGPAASPGPRAESAAERAARQAIERCEQEAGRRNPDQRQQAGAIEACQAAVAAAPNEGRAVLRLARAYRAASRPEEARAQFERAAALGEADALTQLGRIHELGLGTPMNLAEARRLYEQAAALGQAEAMTALGALHAFGRGTPQNLAEARAWYERAAALGDAQAMTALGGLFEKGRGIAQDAGEARRWYERAAGSGSAAAMSALGRLHEQGLGGPQDYAAARSWYERAANLGDAEGAISLGYLHERGLGVPRSKDEARRWYDRAAALEQQGPR